MTDAAGRTITREHPEHILLDRLEECESLRSVLEFCVWVLSEIGYKKLAKAATKRLQEAIEEAAAIEETAEVSFPTLIDEENRGQPS